MPEKNNTEKIKNIISDLSVPCLFNEPMYEHTTFKTGGNADFFFTPSSVEEIEKIIKASKELDRGIFVLGEGANILVSDKGIREFVIDTSFFNSKSIDREKNLIRADSGVLISDLAAFTVSEGFEGLETFYGMPGSTGGAVYMNARCYEREISDIFFEAEVIDESGKIKNITYQSEDWNYKKSPFQNDNSFILRSTLKIKPVISSDFSTNLYDKMLQYKQNRYDKGHFNFPCAGSTFKNNRAFGQPTGKIIDSLGLKGFSFGDAAVSDYHANIIINRGMATSADIRKLIEYIRETVLTKTGFELEPEVEFVGEW